MANFLYHHPFDPGFALPKYTRAEPPGRGSFHSFGAPRGTISQRPEGWTGGYALPDYISSEPDRRGAIHSYDMRRRSTGMRVPEALGATARSITEAPIASTAKRGAFVDHPLIAVGPWTFNPKGSKVEIADGRLSASGPHLQFLFKAIREISIKAQCATNVACYGPKWRGWSADQFAIPTHKFYWPAIKGQAPIYKVTNPAEGGTWGIFVTRKDRSIVVEFKKIEPSWLAKVAGWIKTVVGVIIDTVKALFDFMGIAACALSRKYLGEVGAVASGRLQLSDESFNWLTTKAGVTEQELDSLSTNATAAMSQNVASKIVAGACPQDFPPPLTTDQALPSWLLPVALGGGALLVVYLMRGRK